MRLMVPRGSPPTLVIFDVLPELRQKSPSQPLLGQLSDGLKGKPAYHTKGQHGGGEQDQCAHFPPPTRDALRSALRR
jgi:hypothetical protein